MARGAGKGNAWFEAALGLHRGGRIAEAVAGYDAALRSEPHHADALASRALALGQLGRFAEALAGFSAALAEQPGHALASQWRPQAATALFEDAEAHAGAGNYSEALAAFAALTAHGPALAQAHYGAAAMHWQLGDASAALGRCERALALDPALGPAHNLRGRALQQIGRGAEALAAFDRALACDPDDALAHQNRGWQLRRAGRIEEALAAFTAAQTLDPALPFAASEILEMKLQLSDWDGLKSAQVALIADVAAETADVVPFALLALTDDPAVQRAAAARFAAQTCPRVAPRLAPHPPGERLRVAYFSADFHAHATMYLLADTLAAHDRARFEITALSYGPPASDVWRARAEAACTRFLDVRAISDAEIAALARSLAIDIAVDLKGLTEGGRPGILAARAAPVQAAWLGYPGTLPAPFIDYFIGDPVTNPPGERSAFAEALALLPSSYQANCRLNETAAPAGSRADHGLPDGAPVLCCFNANYKITPAVFARWMAILAAVPDAVLWLWVALPRARENLARAAATQGIAPERLVFAGFAEREAHLARLGHADLFLDTFPCGAHTTASDALRAALPLITLPGRTFASRVGASLLTAVGLQELITQSEAHYTALAIELAHNRPRLGALRAQLRECAPAAPLFDPVRQARHLERAYAEMDARARRGEEPGDFTVPEA